MAIGKQTKAKLSITVNSGLNDFVKLMHAGWTVCKCFHTFLLIECIFRNIGLFEM